MISTPMPAPLQGDGLHKIQSSSYKLNPFHQVSLEKESGLCHAKLKMDYPPGHCYAAVGEQPLTTSGDGHRAIFNPGHEKLVLAA